MREGPGGALAVNATGHSNTHPSRPRRPRPSTRNHVAAEAEAPFPGCLQRWRQAVKESWAEQMTSQPWPRQP